MKLPKPVEDIVLQILEGNFGSARLGRFQVATGGCINNGGKLETSAGAFFIKWNDSQKLPNLFETEARGLTLLRKANAFYVPSVAGVASVGSYQVIVLEFVEGCRNNRYWVETGERLAALHECTYHHFGLDHDNYIGSLPQYNSPRPVWVRFFIEQRIEIQLKMAIDNGRAEPSIVPVFERLYKLLPSVMPEEKPALLHGDLWINNLIENEYGEPCLIDPAVYYGSRETEIAYAYLFGGFESDFFDAYKATYPMQPGFDKRIDLYNLYPLLVHVNLFGGGYLQQVKAIVRRFA